MQETPARTGKQPDNARQLIERARHILTHEQRSGHQDNVVRPGGIEAFIERWGTQMHAARDRGEIAAPPAGATGRFPEVAILHLLTGYRTLDPMQRAAKIRAALALLDAFDTPAMPNAAAHLAQPPRPQPVPGPAARRPDSASRQWPRRQTSGGLAPEENWPLAKPLPPPPVLPAERPRPATPPREPRPEDEYLLQAPVTAVPAWARRRRRDWRDSASDRRDLLLVLPARAPRLQHAAEDRRSCRSARSAPCWG